MENTFISVPIERQLIDFVGMRMPISADVSLPDKLSAPNSLGRWLTIKEVARKRDVTTGGASDIVTVYANYFNSVSDVDDSNLFEEVSRIYALLTSNSLCEKTCVVRAIMEQCTAFSRVQQSGRPIVHYFAVLVYQVGNKVYGIDE